MAVESAAKERLEESVAQKMRPKAGIAAIAAKSPALAYVGRKKFQASGRKRGA